MYSIMPCNPSQLTQYQLNQTSADIVGNNVIVDRVSGKPFIIQNPFFDLMLSGSTLSFVTDSQRISNDKLVLILKCLLIIQTLPEAALEETAHELEGIYHFYKDRQTQINLPEIPSSKIKGKLKAMQVRPPIVLES
jgi:hypothetical protein